MKQFLLSFLFSVRASISVTGIDGFIKNFRYGFSDVLKIAICNQTNKPIQVIVAWAFSGIYMYQN